MDSDPIHRSETVKQSCWASLVTTCFFVRRKYSLWYMWSLAGSSTHTQEGSDVLPCTLSFHLKSGRMVSLTLSRVPVMGWMLASTSMELHQGDLLSCSLDIVTSIHMVDQMTKKRKVFPENNFKKSSCNSSCILCDVGHVRDEREASDPATEDEGL